MQCNNIIANKRKQTKQNKTIQSKNQKKEKNYRKRLGLGYFIFISVNHAPPALGGKECVPHTIRSYIQEH